MTGHEPLTLVRFKFPKSLGNLAEPSDLQLEPGALSDFPRRQLASTRSRRIPFGEVRDVDHRREYLLDGFVYDLDAFDYSHEVPLELPQRAGLIWQTSQRMAAHRRRCESRQSSRP